MAKDPIARFARMLTDHGVLTAEEVAGLEAEVDGEIADAIEFAKAGPDPMAADVTANVYTVSPA